MMKKLLICFALFSRAVFCVEAAFPYEEVQEMAARDKEVRLSWIYSGDEESARSIRVQERASTRRLQEILESYGLPQEGSEVDLSSIVQLALRSSNLAFQQELLEQASAAGKPWSNLFGTLEDRVLIRQGLPQRYGSHLYWEKEGLVPYPIEDVANVDALRAAIGEPPLHEYIAIMQAIAQALQKNNDADLYKIFFNIAHDFNNNPHDYLYYASLEPDGAPPENAEGTGFLAFEDPASAAAYTLLQTMPIFGDVCWSAEEGQPEYLSVLVFIRTQEDLSLLQKPVYLSLVRREDFFQSGASSFQNRLLVSAEKKRPVAECLCNSFLEVLISGGSALRIHDGLSEYTIKDSTIKEMLLCALFFDVTLNHEVFEE